MKTQLEKQEKRINELSTNLTSLTKANSELKQTLEIQIAELSELGEEKACVEKNLSEANKTINEVKIAYKKIQTENEKKLNSVRNEITLTKEKISDCEQIAKRFDNEQLNGVASVNNKIKLMIQRNKTVESDMVESSKTITECSLAVTTLQKQYTEMKKQLREKRERNTCNGNNSKAADGKKDVAKTTSDQSGVHVTRQIQIQTENRFTVLDTNSTSDDTHSSIPDDTVTRVDNTPRQTDRPQTAPTYASRAQIKNITTRGTDQTYPKSTVEDTNTQSAIPVHFPSSACKSYRDLANKFVGYKKSGKQKISRFYVYGINSRIASESSMREFLEQSKVHVTFLRYFQKQWKHTASAQMNIFQEDEHIVQADHFWPEGIGMRPWQPREVFLDDHRRG